MFNHRNYSEKELVEGCVTNNRRAQEILYKQYFAKMMGMCMRYTSDRDKAMLIVNNGFLKVFKKLDTFSFKGSLEGWIRKIVYHSLSEYFKKESKYLHFLVFEEKDTSTTQTAALSNLYMEDILEMVTQLPPATQQVFNLYAIEGFTHVEIAKNLDISVGTSKWHLSNARQKLKEILRKSNSRQYAG